MRGRITRFRAYFIGAATEIYALALALRDPHSSWAARLVALAFALYVINPIDIIPEPVPFIGILDDLMAFPLAYVVVSRMLPKQLMEGAHRHAANSHVGERLWKAFLIVLGLLSILWMVAFVGLGITIYRAVS